MMLNRMLMMQIGRRMLMMMMREGMMIKRMLMMLIGRRMLMMMKREGVWGTCHLNGLALRGRSAVGILFLQILTSATHKGFFSDDFDFDFDNHETMVHNITIVPLLP